MILVTSDILDELAWEIYQEETSGLPVPIHKTFWAVAPEVRTQLRAEALKRLKAKDQGQDSLNRCPFCASNE